MYSSKKTNEKPIPENYNSTKAKTRTKINGKNIQYSNYVVQYYNKF